MNIFLEQNRSKKSVNTSSGINVELKGKRKLLPQDDIAKTINQHDQYMKERGECNIIRLTCQVNPICTNVLHNYVTEIVKNEGSPEVKFLNYNTNITGDTFANVKYKEASIFSGDSRVTEAVRDTQLTSNSVGFKYHCGRDIFNNHLVRSNTFKTVCKMPNGDKSQYFNTIRDKMRTADGDKVSEKIGYPLEAGLPDNLKKIGELHLYEYDDIYTYNDCVENRLLEKYNGWVGFENKSKMKSYDWKLNEAEELPIERPIMYMNGGDFVDMYPDRSLYSFVPKWNPFRHRIEKNWNYCLTYPSSSTTEGFDGIIEQGTNSLKALAFNEDTRSDNGSSQLVIYSYVKHGLKEGDFVNIYKTSGGTTTKILDNAEISNVVDNFVFTVFSNVAIGSGNTLSYKKVVGDVECDYYVRIFSKLPNFKFASADTTNEYELYKNNGETISTYQSREYEFENHISRLAFAKNIYTDEVGQLVFTDDIDISNLKDNLGRPLTSIYLTFIKNNRGYKEWYGFDDTNVNIGADTVEYSHCFGKITCGLEMVDDNLVDLDNEEKDDEDIRENLGSESGHCINTMVFNEGYEVSGLNQNRTSNVSATEVSYYEDKHFYGDLCCYDNYNANEEVIQPFMFRFNTAQRESINASSSGSFATFKYDEITRDDYDVDTFYVDEKSFGDCNNKNEGYYYKPHYEIPIKTFGTLMSIMPDFIDILKLTWVSETSLEVTTLQNHYLSVGDKTVLRVNNDSGDIYYDCVTVKGENDNSRRFTCMLYDEKGNDVTSASTTLNVKDCTMFKIDNLDAPSYARVLKDGTCRLVWRGVINNGMSTENRTMEEYPFTNGAFYINKRFDIYVRRQDPYEYWGSYSKTDLIGVEVDIEREDYFVKEKDIVC